MADSFSTDTFRAFRQRNLASFEELGYPDWRKAKMAKVDVKKAYCERDKGADMDWRCADKKLDEKGVVVARLTDVDHSLLDDFVNRLDLGVQADKLAAFHWANVNDGLLIVVPRRTVVESPIRISTGQLKGRALATMVVVVVEEEAEVSLEEGLNSDSWDVKDGSDVLCSTSTHVFAGQGSTVKYSCVQNWGRQVYDLGYRQLVADRDAMIDATFGVFGAGAGRTVISGVTNGRGAEVRQSGVFVGGGGQRMKLVTRNLHFGPESMGRMLYKGTLADKAQSDLDSLIYVDAKAVGTSSELVDATLLLSSDARADSTPALDVHTDDVQCKHSASVKATDKEQLFYLMTRGLDRETAQRLVVEGFFEEVLKKDSSGWIREKMTVL